MERGIKSFAGPLFFAAFAVLFFSGSYAMWPSDFFSTPFSGMPAAMLLRAVGSPVLAIVGLEFLAALAIAVLSDS